MSEAKEQLKIPEPVVRVGNILCSLGVILTLDPKDKYLNRITNSIDFINFEIKIAETIEDYVAANDDNPQD